MRDRWRPTLRTLLVAVNVLVLVAPIGGLWALRLYESSLVRQTESELLGQAAFLSAAYRQALRRARGSPLREPAAVPTPQPGERWQPRGVMLDLAVDEVRPRPPAAPPASAPAAPDALAAGREVMGMMHDAQLVTLAAIRVVDRRGTVVATTAEELGASLMDREEITRALAGESVSLLRERVSDEPPPPLASASRGTHVRVFVAEPIVEQGVIVGAVLLSRSPRGIGQTLYGKRYLLLGSGVVLVAVVVAMSLVTSRAVARPLAAVVEQTERAARGERGAVTPLDHAFTREVARLWQAVAAMARSLEERADYIRGFASHVSHEFKTPLAAIQGAVELLRTHDATMQPEKRVRFLGNVAADAVRLERLVRRLLELARADVLQPAGVAADVSRIAADVAARYRENGLSVDVAAVSGGVRAAIDPDTLDSVLSSLLDNARQHGGGTVRMRVAVDERRNGAMPSAMIRVADEGPGISAANAAKVFDPFFTTARDRGGTGLGLTIARSLVDAHGGTICLVATERGAAFEILLPLG
jgi:signal transduction histidine kinase